MRGLAVSLLFAAVGLAAETPGVSSPPGGLARFCCLSALPSGQAVFLDAAAAELWQWDGSRWQTFAKLSPLPCTPTAFAIDPPGHQVAVACRGLKSPSRAEVFTTTVDGGAAGGWRKLPPVPLAAVVSLAFHRESWEVAGVPCVGALGNCEPGGVGPRAGSSFPAWFRWEENRWTPRGTATWDPHWEKLVEAACRKPQLSHPRPCQRYPHLERMLQLATAQYGFSAQSVLLAPTASGGLWAGPASGQSFKLLTNADAAVEVRVGQDPPPLVDIETPASYQEPRRAALGPVQGTLRHQIPVRRYLAAATFGERLYLLRKGERWELVVSDPDATRSVPLPTAQELCPPGPFPGFYGPCSLAVGPSFVVTGPPWVVVALPEGWDRKPGEPQERPEGLPTHRD